jgi:hypothetical protein
MVRQNKGKSSGRKKNEVWEYFEQTPLKSPGHYSGECKFCNKKWQRAYVGLLQFHLANECIDCPEEIQTYWLGYIAAKDSLEDDTASIASRESNQSTRSNKKRKVGSDGKLSIICLY